MNTSYKNGACAMVLAAAMASTGCGTMFGGSRQLIQAASIPEGATVAAAGTAGSRTPTSLSLERKNNDVLEFSAPGYTTQRVDVQKSLRGGIVVLDILGGLLPVIVDAITGGWYALSPEQVNAMLTKVDATTPGPDTIGVTLNLDGAGRSDKAEVAIVSTVPGVAVSVRTRRASGVRRWRCAEMAIPGRVGRGSRCHVQQGPDRRAVIRARIQRSAALARAVDAIRLVPGNRRGVRHGIDNICI